MVYRCYFNSHADAPFVASIDTGDDTTELNVKSITLVGGNCKRSPTVYRPEKQPKFWFEVDGELDIQDGHAVITL